MMTEELTEATCRSTVPSKRGSGIESGGSKNLSDLTKSDPVPSHSILQECGASSETKYAHN